MKQKLYIFIIITFITVIFNHSYSQQIPTDSLYLGQTPPGNIPKIFKLPVTPGSFAAERIAISGDGKEIYYSEIKSYYPITGAKTKYYSYSNGKWNGPFNLFDEFACPSLSLTGDTMYLEAFYSVKKDLKWSNPKKFLDNFDKSDSLHYLQVTNSGNYYVSSKPKKGIGGADWCRLFIKGRDATVLGLGMPLNSIWDDQDFFVSRDETFMIVATRTGLAVSYHKKDDNWTNPKNLGSKINFGLGMWGTYMSADNKYLFYSTGTKPDYSDVYVYWIRIDGLIDSLKHTNFIPYVKTLLTNQTKYVKDKFNFTIPEDTFFDNDENNTLTYSATLSTGDPLPSWLSFNPDTRTFSGTPVTTGEFKIKVKVTDNAKASAVCLFSIIITDNPKK